MALQKEIILDNGITLNYHRIVSLNVITNIKNTIEIGCYINEEQRLKEQKYQETQRKNVTKEELTKEEKEIIKKGNNSVIETKYIDTNYDETMSIKSAYEYLKQLDDFKNAEDV